MTDQQLLAIASGLHAFADALTRGLGDGTVAAPLKPAGTVASPPKPVASPPLPVPAPKTTVMLPPMPISPSAAVAPPVVIPKPTPVSTGTEQTLGNLIAEVQPLAMAMVAKCGMTPWQAMLRTHLPNITKIREATDIPGLQALQAALIARLSSDEV